LLKCSIDLNIPRGVERIGGEIKGRETRKEREEEARKKEGDGVCAQVILSY
jgi:hypothetical protein